MDIVEAQKIKVLRSKSRIVRELANCRYYGYCGSSKNKSSEIKVRIGETIHNFNCRNLIKNHAEILLIFF